MKKKKTRDKKAKPTVTLNKGAAEACVDSYSVVVMAPPDRTQYRHTKTSADAACGHTYTSPIDERINTVNTPNILCNRTALPRHRN